MIICYFTSFYEYMKPILIYGNKKIILLKVTNKLYSEKKRLIDRSKGSPENLIMITVENKKIKNFIKKKIFY